MNQGYIFSTDKVVSSPKTGLTINFHATQKETPQAACPAVQLGENENSGCCIYGNKNWWFMHNDEESNNQNIRENNRGQ